MRRRLWAFLALLAVGAVIGANRIVTEHDRDAARVMLAHADDASGADTVRAPAASDTTVVAKTAVARETKSDPIRPEAVKGDAGRAEAAKPDAGKAACEETTWSYLDGKCVAGNARKPRVVRVPTNRPAIAGVTIGRVAPPADPAADGRKGEAAASKPVQAVPAEAAVAAASVATDPSQPPAAATKKPQKATQARRRDPSAPSWREVRAPAGGVAPQAQFGFGGFFGMFR